MVTGLIATTGTASAADTSPPTQPGAITVSSLMATSARLSWAKSTDTGMAMDRATIGKIVNLVKTKRPDLMLLTDDVYGTFVNDFRSLLGELPHIIIGVYFYSKYSGCTGWRLGVIAIHEDNSSTR